MNGGLPVSMLVNVTSLALRLFTKRNFSRTKEDVLRPPERLVALQVYEDTYGSTRKNPCQTFE